MSKLVRFTVSMEQPLFELLEQHVGASEYGNRSEFVRDLIRAHLVQEDWDEGDGDMLGVISLVYDHHSPGLSQRLTHEQHHFVGNVLATTHIHLDHDLCAEMIMVRGPAADIRLLTSRLRREKGVVHAQLSVSTTGAPLPRSGKHAHDRHGNKSSDPRRKRQQPR